MLLISILSGTAVGDIRHPPTPLHIDTNDVGVIGDTLIQYGKVEGFAALIIGDVEYEILPHSSFRVPVGALHGTFGSGIREVTAIDSVTGLSVGLLSPICPVNGNPNCRNISPANINTDYYYRCWRLCTPNLGSQLRGSQFQTACDLGGFLSHNQNAPLDTHPADALDAASQSSVRRAPKTAKLTQILKIDGCRQGVDAISALCHVSNTHDEIPLRIQRLIATNWTVPYIESVFICINDDQRRKQELAR